MPVAKVRPNVVKIATARLVSLRSVRRSPHRVVVLARQKPLIGVLPVVVKTKSLPAMRGRPAMMLFAHGTIGTACGSSFLTRSRGTSTGSIRIEFAPAHAGDFLPSLAGQNRNRVNGPNG